MFVSLLGLVVVLLRGNGVVDWPSPFIVAVVCGVTVGRSGPPFSGNGWNLQTGGWKTLKDSSFKPYSYPFAPLLGFSTQCNLTTEIDNHLVSEFECVNRCVAGVQVAGISKRLLNE